MITAKEFINEMHDGNMWEKALINFAKLHVQEALKQASEKVKVDGFWQQFLDNSRIDKDTILEAYSLENIK